RRRHTCALGPNAPTLAAQAGGGLILAGPSSRTVEMFRSRGGAEKPIQGGIKVCWGNDEGAARRLARERWPTEALVGEALQLLPLPRHFEQLTDRKSVVEGSR